MTDKLTRTIKAISVKKKAEGSIGFLTNEEDKWYNINADEPALDTMLETIIRKGNKIEFEMDNGVPGNFKVLEEAKESGNADDLISFEELLNKAHEKFKDNFTIRTYLVSNDMEKKHAVFKAKIEIYADENQIKKFTIGELSEETKDPIRVRMAEFEAYGDATQENCGDLVKKHWIRMAETRAIARALRWATNNAKTAAEETEDGGEQAGPSKKKK